MKKLIILLSIILILSSVKSVYAEVGRAGLMPTTYNANSSSSAEKQLLKTQLAQDKVTDLKQRAKKEITRRIEFLNELSAKITNLKKISDADKTSLKTQIQQQVDGLTALQVKIDADTDLATLKTDVQSIVKDYYIFAFFRVKISLLVAAERLSVTADNLSAVYTKLSARVTEQKTQGKDVASLEALLSDMQAKIADAKTQYQSAMTELNALTVQDYSKNKTVLTNVKPKIKLGASDLRKAFDDAMKIRKGLGDISGNLKPKAGSESALQKYNPEK